MKIVALVTLVGFVALMVGCAMPMNVPVYGGLFTQVKGPIAVGDPTAACTKVGTAEAQAIVCFATGDASIKAAAEKAGIKKIHHVDTECFSVMGVYAKTKTVVYGE